MMMMMMTDTVSGDVVCLEQSLWWPGRPCVWS